MYLHGNVSQCKLENIICYLLVFTSFSVMVHTETMALKKFRCMASMLFLVPAAEDCVNVFSSSLPVSLLPILLVFRTGCR